MIPLNIVNQIEIKAPASSVWDALTNPEMTKQYMFGCETISDWEIGSALLWQGEYEGKKMVFVKGHIVDLVPNQLLSYTVIDPNGSIPDIPENYLTVSYELVQKEGYTLFTVTQGDYNKVAEGAKRFEESSNGGEGWNPILKAIKALIEA
ncbi:MAG: hypothetical protein B7Y15_02960 [Bacteroidetes bacterium 24-39-8]|jgi:uncharacterized protein YndB with AHSA1/START domain|nr:MAG: hypothetical protein B7Y15_02960 [Bacteroidetes bacterium 24-39-8]HQS54104.1 SRPBCC domain-containing protein [Sediminibacterium sp.]